MKLTWKLFNDALNNPIPDHSFEIAQFSKAMLIHFKKELTLNDEQENMISKLIALSEEKRFAFSNFIPFIFPIGTIDKALGIYQTFEKDYKQKEEKNLSSIVQKAINNNAIPGSIIDYMKNNTNKPDALMLVALFSHIITKKQTLFVKEHETILNLYHYCFKALTHHFDKNIFNSENREAVHHLETILNQRNENTLLNLSFHISLETIKPSTEAKEIVSTIGTIYTTLQDVFNSINLPSNERNECLAID